MDAGCVVISKLVLFCAWFIVYTLDCTETERGLTNMLTKLAAMDVVKGTEIIKSQPSSLAAQYIT